MSRKTHKEILKNVLIGDLVEGNRCVARVNNQVIFVENAAPGDVMDIQIFKKKRAYAEAIPIQLHTPSPARVEAFCKHFGTCGGCQWQHISYENQLLAKEQQIKEKLIRLGNVPYPPISPIIPADPNRYYRNKLEYTFSNKGWLTEAEIQTDQILERQALGFHKPGYFDKIVDITHCYLQEDPSNKIRLAIAKFAKEENFTFYDIRNNQGLLRNLIIRTTSTGEVMVIVQFGELNQEKITSMMEFIYRNFPILTSLQYIVNTKHNETFYDLTVQLYKGKPFITEMLDGLQWQIGPKSFFQTNSYQATILYKTVERLADLQGHELIYDLYTGVGTIASFLARKAREVVGIEIIESALEDAKLNAQINNLTNVKFWLGDMKDVFNKDLLEKFGYPDIIVVDPPRAGMHLDVVQQLLTVAPKKIIYVSCNPATQARDIKELQAKYELINVQPIDMFPHTSHVENVALLILKS